ncbi:leucine-rich repeat receptor protein kinase MSP1-like [Wolffia australiana]
MEPGIQALVAACGSFLLVGILFGGAILWRRAAKGWRRVDSAPAAPPAEETVGFFEPSLARVSMAVVAAATGNFSADRIVGDGGFGFVYRAEMPDGRAVAVKKLSPDAFHGLREFRAEVETLGRVRHPNLARILGYCAAGPDRVLIYELAERGSLDQWLHEPGPDRPPLTWPARLRIAGGVAAGLAFLHGCRPPIIHRDIKAGNVLLDEDFRARITDFGLARWAEPEKLQISTQVAGTAGYMPPEYGSGVVAATVMADVYSFGVLVFELAAGRRPSWPVVVGVEEVALVGWARRKVQRGEGRALLDPAMGSGPPATARGEAQLEAVLDVALRCTSDSAKARPSMAEVVSLLAQVPSLGDDDDDDDDDDDLALDVQMDLNNHTQC